MLQRQSNIELLRIVTMFLVLVVHADFMALGEPKPNDMYLQPLSTVARILMESLSIVCVNVFVLVSGWFGIRPNVKGVTKFLFQSFFFLFAIYAFFLMIGEGEKFSVDYLFMKDYWFVKAYLGLLIIAPLMNAFIEKASKKQMLVFLLCFYIFQTLYGWVVFSADFIMNGYSTFSFIGLYMLGRYVRLYPSQYTGLNSLKCLGVYFFINIFLTIISVLLLLFDQAYYLQKVVMSYVNPFTILASLYLLLGFVKMQFTSNFINWIAVSSFAVYLLHCNRYVLDEYLSICRYMYQEYSGIVYIILIFLILSAVFLLAVLIDRIRIFFWGYLEKVVLRVRDRSNFLKGC
ncbi:MAG TPA: hypothetical protein H9818_08530 [Candidatus Phocaeicola gallistercoris]|nr:hypothetical protein [Candidatus Phocaeicola gallistercoris]